MNRKWSLPGGIKKTSTGRAEALCPWKHSCLPAHSSSFEWIAICIYIMAVTLNINYMPSTKSAAWSSAVYLLLNSSTQHMGAGGQGGSHCLCPEGVPLSNSHNGVICSPSCVPPTQPVSVRRSMHFLIHTKAPHGLAEALVVKMPHIVYRI